MRELTNPWIHTEGYNCFGCSPDNPLGMHMHFYQDGEDIVSIWLPTQNHQSWINTLHGGVQAVLLDEICGWVIFAEMHTSGVTAKMDIRYKHSVDTTIGPIVLRAKIKERKHNIAIVAASITDANGTVCAQCECTYFTFAADKAVSMQFHTVEQIGPELTLQEAIAKATTQHNHSH
ncbi:MAG: PaaI family thioesterase [Paludibacter sp.]|nr:PaaI family thioesterase [Bacteroidales bacterium]MCM1069589.1 PaaI family thioesterase [Prevotella sp.]MCM1354235.1 PaaI family thioesterase [Bacteroides sp.]MCM1443026.1 PaaI family thioesterase [Muribaculum sp.]MCM1482309.1 PaaI family thioesterase [Paludibacter sp.]